MQSDALELLTKAECQKFNQRLQFAALEVANSSRIWCHGVKPFFINVVLILEVLGSCHTFIRMNLFCLYFLIHRHTHRAHPRQIASSAQGKKVHFANIFFFLKKKELSLQ